MAPLSLPDLPALSTSRVTVRAAGFSTTAIQKLANDVAAGNVDKIISSCWTQPSSELRLVYGSASMRGAILQALTQTGQGAQGGGTWTGQYVTVSAYWEELDSAYACISVFWDDARTYGLGSFTPAMAQLRLDRILGAHNGAPVHSGDGTKYQLVCDQDCTGAWAPHDGDPNATSPDPPPILSATSAQWEQLRVLAHSGITVELLGNGYYRVRSTDDSVKTLAYFTGSYTDNWLPYLLGEIAEQD